MYTPSPLFAFRFARHRDPVTPLLPHSISVTMPAALPQVELSLLISHPASTSVSPIVYASLATFISICIALFIAASKPTNKPSHRLYIPIVFGLATAACAVLALRVHLSCFTSSPILPASSHVHLLEGLISLALPSALLALYRGQMRQKTSTPVQKRRNGTARKIMARPLFVDIEISTRKVRSVSVHYIYTVVCIQH